MITDLTLVHTKEWKRNKYIVYFNLILFVLFFQASKAQDTIPHKLGVLFYNVENLFDTKDDTSKQDNEFLPNAVRHWTTARYNSKISKLGRVFYESGEWNLPCFIGLCEIENKTILNDLLDRTGLINHNYQIIHFESEDVRGIDVALLFRSDIFSPALAYPIKINLGSDRPTRDILYAYGFIQKTIPLHIFVCHFPSRYGGVMETENKRMRAVKTLVSSIHNITQKDPDASIVIMGDFNDDPNENSIKYLIQNTHVINLAQHPSTINHSKGTIKYQYTWSIFDQIFISKSLRSKSNLLYTKENMHILDFDFLLQDDLNFTGKRPFRTYYGYKYQGGYSDHLPVWVELYSEQGTVNSEQGTMNSEQ